MADDRQLSKSIYLYVYTCYIILQLLHLQFDIVIMPFNNSLRHRRSNIVLPLCLVCNDSHRSKSILKCDFLSVQKSKLLHMCCLIELPFGCHKSPELSKSDYYWTQNIDKKYIIEIIRNATLPNNSSFYSNIKKIWKSGFCF